MFRNKELKYFFLIFSFITLISISTGLYISKLAGIIILISDLSFGVLFFIFTKARYKKIEDISQQIDLVLHDDDYLFINEMEEGELSILQSEITKMTLRIKEQNHALKKEKEYLAQSLADIAHQLRTPLTSINIILSLLENNQDEDEGKSLIREAEELFVHMDWLLTSLLKLSRVDAGIAVFQREEIDVNKLIRTSIQPLMIPMELHNINLKIDIPKEIKIKGDLGWLSEAIRNIIKNCMESAGDNGLIEITCNDNPLFTEITIHDSGKGIEKEDLPYLFDRFYRGKNSNATGYGIGLALCKMIITSQDGIIKAKNHPKGGAIFIIRFQK